MSSLADKLYPTNEELEEKLVELGAKKKPKKAKKPKGRKKPSKKKKK